MNSTVTGIFKGFGKDLSTEKYYKKQILVEETGRDKNYLFGILITKADVMTFLQPVSIGDTITCHCNVKGREYQDKWYNDLELWKIDAPNSTGNKNYPSKANSNGAYQQRPQKVAAPIEIDPDLPF